MRIFGTFHHLTDDPETPFFGELFPDQQTVATLPEHPWKMTGTSVELFPDNQPGRSIHSLSDLRIACPVRPSKIIAVGRNYHAHAKERGADAPTSPMTWLMAPSSLLAHEGAIELPFPEHRVDFEAELGIVIGRPAKNVSVADAADYIFGYTTCQDISDRDIQDAEKQFARAKGFDTFTPVGPYVYADIDPDDLRITLRQNGELRQDGSTREMIFNVREIVAFCSQGTTLLPGDLILSGTPAGVGPIRDGDVLETCIGTFAPLVVTVRNAA